MTEKTTHVCPAKGCRASVSWNKLSCPKHWRKVSPATQRLVYRTWRAGDVVGHQEAMTTAIAEMNT